MPLTTPLSIESFRAQMTEKAMADLVLIEDSAYFADPHAALGLVAADGAALARHIAGYSPVGPSIGRPSPTLQRLPNGAAPP